MRSASEVLSPRIKSDWFYYLSPIGWLRINIVCIREGSPIYLLYVKRLELQLWRCSYGLWELPQVDQGLKDTRLLPCNKCFSLQSSRCRRRFPHHQHIIAALWTTDIWIKVCSGNLFSSYFCIFSRCGPIEAHLTTKTVVGLLQQQPQKTSKPHWLVMWLGCRLVLVSPPDDEDDRSNTNCRCRTFSAGFLDQTHVFVLFAVNCLVGRQQITHKVPKHRAVGHGERRVKSNSPADVALLMCLLKSQRPWLFARGAKSRRLRDKKKQNCRLCLDADSFLAPSYPSKFLRIHGSTWSSLPQRPGPVCYSVTRTPAS